MEVTKRKLNTFEKKATKIILSYAEELADKENLSFCEIRFILDVLKFYYNDNELKREINEDAI